MAFEYFCLRWEIPQPVPMLSDPHSEKSLSWCSDSTSCLCLLPLVVSLSSTEKSLAPSSLRPPSRHLSILITLPLRLLFTRLNSCSPQPLLLYWAVFSSSISSLYKEFCFIYRGLKHLFWIDAFYEKSAQSSTSSFNGFSDEPIQRTTRFLNGNRGRGRFRTVSSF